MQKRKSFLLKLFVLLTVVFCTFALVFGMVGCAAGEKGEAGRGIANTKIENGKLYVQYTDSTTWVEVGQVAGEDGEDGEDGKDGAQGGTLKADCEHDFAKHVIRYANCSEGGLAIEICSKCDGYQTVETDVDEDVHGSYELKPDAYGVMKLEFTSYGVAAGNYRAATCTEDGFNHTVCSKCGETLDEGIIPKLNHMDTKQNGDKVDAYKLMHGARENGNECMHGSYEAYVCTLCFDIDEEGITVTDSEGTKVHTKPVYTPAREYHTADASWNLVINPTETTKGAIEGICTLCNEEQTIELPAFNETYEGAPAYDVDVPTCVEAAAALNAAALKKTYSLNAAWVAKYGYSATFEFAYTITHRVNDGTNNHLFVEGETYDYDEVSALITAGYINWSAGNPANCEDDKYAVISACADCGEEVVIKAFGTHVWENVVDEDDELVVVAPTCTADGYYTQECSVCGETKTVKNADATGHTWKKVGETANASTVTISAECEDCDATTTITGTKNVSESTDATCTAPSKTVYDYEINGVADKIIITGDSVVPHKSALGLEIVEGEEYDYEDIEAKIADVKWSAGVPGNCSEKKFAIIDCIMCTHEIVFIAQGTHTWENVVDEDGQLVVVAPTCTTDGYYTKECTVCGETKDVKNADATGHTLKKVSERVVDAGLEITVKCDDCDYTTTIIGVKNDLLSKAATCTEPSKTAYDYSIAGVPQEPIYITGDSVVAHKSVNGLEVIEGEEYEYEDIEAKLADITWSAGVPGDCLTTKYAIIDCVMCSHEIVFVAQGTHNYQDVVDEDNNIIYHDATCLEDGYYEKACAVCGDTKSIKTSDATGHTWVKVGEQAGANGTIIIEVECEDCDATNTITGTKNELLSKAATCTDPAKVVYDYEINGTPAQITVTEGEALGHDYIPEEALTWKVTVGTKTYQCTGKICQVCHVLVVFDMVEIV